MFHVILPQVGRVRAIAILVRLHHINLPIFRASGGYRIERCRYAGFVIVGHDHDARHPIDEGNLGQGG